MRTVQEITQKLNADGYQYRASVVQSIDEESRTVELSFSSEEPYERWFGLEILGHDSTEIRMDWAESGHAPLLADHDRQKQIGVVQDVRIEGKKGRATVKFSRNSMASEIWQDIVDNIKGNVSVGYIVHEMILVEERKDEPNIYRVTDWEILELSIVSIPADRTVGVGRSSQGDSSVISQPHPKEGKTMKEEKEKKNDTGTANDNAVNDAVVAERARANDIGAIGKKHGFQEKAEEYIRGGNSVQEFKDFVLENMGNGTPVRQISNDNNGGAVGMSEKEVGSYSLVKAIEAAFTGDWSKAGLEKEAMDATLKKYKERKFNGNLIVPVDVLIGKRAQRDMNVAVDSQGGYLVGTQQPMSMIDLLRNKMFVRELGGRVVSGLVGDVGIPKVTGGSTAYWVGEGDNVPESNGSVGQVTAKPKTVGANIDLTRKLIQQSSPDIEMLVRDLIARDIALEIDRVVINGSGVDGEPLGILNTDGVTTLDYGSALTWANIVQLETNLATDNVETGSLAYLTTPGIRGSLKTTLKASGVSGFIWDDKEVNGYRAAATNQVPADRMLFGDWSDCIICEWGALDMNVDKSNKIKSGGVEIVALQDVDVAFLRTESFSYAYT